MKTHEVKNINKEEINLENDDICFEARYASLLCCIM
jgi:hypothetical protein